MRAKGKGMLRLAGVLEILCGVGGFLLLQWILRNSQLDGLMQDKATGLQWAMILIYTTLGLQVIAGILGVVLADDLQKAGLCYVLGLVLILLQSSNYYTQSFSMENVLKNTLMLVPSVLYFYGASLNKQQSKSSRR